MIFCLLVKDLCGDLGVPIAMEKTQGPVQTITYLGLEIDTMARQVRAPAPKVEALCNKIHAALGNRNCLWLKSNLWWDH